MRISIIVPALNEEACISATLRSLQDLDGEKEIIVVDGGSRDATASLVRAAGVKLLRTSPGRGTQMRAGALDATGSVLWFVHADTLPPADSLSQIRTQLADPAIAGGNFGLDFDGPSRAARQLTAIYPFLRRIGLCYGDSGIFVRREIYDRIGGSRSIGLFEDLDLLRRLRGAGRFVHLSCRIRTSSRRFENRNFGVMWLQWTALQILYWCGVAPDRLARWYGHARHGSR